MDLSQVIIKPMVTEKATALGEKRKYIFRVFDNATPQLVKQAIETIYKVKVIKVNCLRVKPRQRRRGRITGRSSGFKKAIVTLRKGDKIEVYEGA